MARSAESRIKEREKRKGVLITAGLSEKQAQQQEHREKFEGEKPDSLLKLEEEKR